ncbi:hypothetical protein BASA81_000968 [Batrachochytrium salamandrivorans]|nr:hypothetical protein BASA81_000968 [Batrachochytrium salamandrivorans]
MWALLLLLLPALAQASFPVGSLKGHLTLSELEAWQASKLRENPALMRQLDLGRSVHNRSLTALCLGEACVNNHSLANEVLYTALHHAREPLGMMSLVAFVHDLLGKHAQGDLSIKRLLRQTTLYFILVVNPDGYVDNETNLNQMRRKNLGKYCTSEVAKVRDQESGVDLNRNYQFCFDRDEVGGNRNECEIDYQGPHAFSEPETRAVRDFVLQRNFKVAFNYHSFGRQIYLPYSCQAEGATKDNAFFFRFAARITRNTAYQYGQPWNSGLYSVNGDASDWMYSERGIIAVSPEVAPSDPVASERAGFWVPTSTVHNLARETLEMNLAGAWTAGVCFDVMVTAQGKLLVVNAGLLPPAQGPILVVGWGEVWQTSTDLQIKGQVTVEVEREWVVPNDHQATAMVGVKDAGGNCAVFAVNAAGSRPVYRGVDTDPPCAKLFDGDGNLGGSDGDAGETHPQQDGVQRVAIVVLVVVVLSLLGLCMWRWRTMATTTQTFQPIPVVMSSENEDEEQV